MERQMLYNTHGLLLLFTGAAVALLYRTVQTNKRDLSALWIAAATFCGGIALLVLSQGHTRLTDLLGAALFLATPPLLQVAIGAAARESTRRTLPWVIGLAAIGFVVYAFTGSMVPALLSIPVVELVNIWLLLRDRVSITRLANVAMSVFLGVHIVMFALRANAMLHHRTPTGILAYGGMLGIIGIGISFVGMEALRSRYEFELMAMTDPLTGLLNRRALDLLATRELARCIRLQQPCSALMMDIDRFKEINDAMGHAAGDASLRAVADILQSLLRLGDITTRHGGDEFFVLMPDCDEEQAAMLIARLRQAISIRTLHSVSGQPFHLHVSIGFATLSGSALTVQALLHDSDVVLYEEKIVARNAAALQAAEERADESGGAQVQPSNA